MIKKVEIRPCLLAGSKHFTWPHTLPPPFLPRLPLPPSAEFHPEWHRRELMIPRQAGTGRTTGRKQNSAVSESSAPSPLPPPNPSNSPSQCTAFISSPRQPHATAGAHLLTRTQTARSRGGMRLCPDVDWTSPSRLRLRDGDAYFCT